MTDASLDARYNRDKEQYIKQSEGEACFLFREDMEYPIITDFNEQAGSVDSHYFFQDIYVASRVSERGIKEIYDVGSRIDGYISHLLAMRIRVKMIDIRPLSFKINGLEFVQGNATELVGITDGSVHDLSCLHALEHFGLGRYGDPVDFFAWEKALNEFKRVIGSGGSLFLSVPSGSEERVMFNAHRIFRPETIVQALYPEMELTEFCCINGGIKVIIDFCDKEYTHEDKLERLKEYADTHMGSYDCGVYIFRRV